MITCYFIYFIKYLQRWHLRSLIFLLLFSNLSWPRKGGCGQKERSLIDVLDAMYCIECVVYNVFYVSICCISQCTVCNVLHNCLQCIVYTHCIGCNVLYRMCCIQCIVWYTMSHLISITAYTISPGYQRQLATQCIVYNVLDAMYGIECVVDNVLYISMYVTSQCIDISMYCLQCIVYSQCVGCNVSYRMCCIVYNVVYNILYTIHCIQCIVYNTL